MKTDLEIQRWDCYAAPTITTSSGFRKSEFGYWCAYEKHVVIVKELLDEIARLKAENEQYRNNMEVAIESYENGLAEIDKLKAERDALINNIGKLKLCDDCVSKNHETMIVTEQILLSQPKDQNQ